MTENRGQGIRTFENSEISSSSAVTVFLAFLLGDPLTEEQKGIVFLQATTSV